MHAREDQHDAQAAGRGHRPAKPPARPSGLAPPGAPVPVQLAALQGLVGNQVVARAVAEERHEHDAGCGHTPSVQRSSVMNVISSPGEPFDGPMREDAESFYGVDLSHLRVHRDTRARQSAREVNAEAYTAGHHMVFDSAMTRQRVRHEVAHAIQQAAGRVSGNDNGDGLSVSDPASPEERQAAAMESASAPTAALQRLVSSFAARAGAAPAPASVARIAIQRRPMHREDRGEWFEITVDGHRVIGRYVRQDGGLEVFDTQRFGRVAVLPGEIGDVRARVGQLRPRGHSPDPAAGRRRVNLSDGDYSYTRAQLRRDPHSGPDIMATVYGPGDDTYPEFAQNERDLHRLGVSTEDDFDLSQPQRVAERLGSLAPDAHLHGQMLRVPQGTLGYSTQQLHRNAAQVPAAMRRDDLTMSFTTPAHDHYPSMSTHNRIYGMENENAVRGTGMRITARTEGDGLGPTERDGLGRYGYRHRQTTRNDTTEAADRRETYYLEPEERRSRSPEDEPGPSTSRRSGRNRSRAPERDRRDEEPRRSGRNRSRPPVTTRGRPPADDSDLEEEPRRSHRNRSRPPLTTRRRPPADDSDRERGRSRGATERTRTRGTSRRPEVNYAAVESEDDFPLSSQVSQPDFGDFRHDPRYELRPLPRRGYFESDEEV